MPSRLRGSTARRKKLVDIIATCPLTMRPCKRCTSRGLECRTSLLSEKCGECIRVSQPCSLVVTAAEFDSVESQLRKVEEEMQRAREIKLEARNKLAKLKKRRQSLLETKGELVNRELQNIEELEADERMIEGQLDPTSGIPAFSLGSPTGLSQVSFSALLSRNTPELQSSS
jgi:hypothetical protein